MQPLLLCTKVQSRESLRMVQTLLTLLIALELKKIVLEVQKGAVYNAVLATGSQEQRLAKDTALCENSLLTLYKPLQ